MRLSDTPVSQRWPTGSSVSLAEFHRVVFQLSQLPQEDDLWMNWTGWLDQFLHVCRTQCGTGQAPASFTHHNDYDRSSFSFLSISNQCTFLSLFKKEGVFTVNKNRTLIRISSLGIKSKLKKWQTRVEAVTPRTKVEDVGLLADSQLLLYTLGFT